MNAFKNLMKGKPAESTTPAQPAQQSPAPPQPQPPNPQSSPLKSSLGVDDEPKVVELRDDQVQQEDRKRLFSKLTGLIGKDIVSLLSLPVSMFEPTSVLQTMVEPLRNSELLFKISTTEDPIDRICLVAAFCTSLFSYYVRTMKPFNPVLGETYEYVPSSKAYKSLCEQVSHHPPIGIAHSTCDDWTLSQESHIATRFWGTSVDLQSLGDNHLTLPKRDDHYTWKAPNACIHNILFGKLYVDYQGTIPVQSMKGGESASINFKKAGWFGGSTKEISGEARTKDGTVRAIFTGKWDEFFAVQKVDENGAKSSFVELWRKPASDSGANHKWKWDPFVDKLTELTEEMESTLPQTDSRLRADLRALTKSDLKAAGKEKLNIEERERRKRREREAQGKKWSPQYFKKVADDHFEYRWEYTGNYWEDRSTRLQQHKEKQKLNGEERKVEVKTILDDMSDPVGPIVVESTTVSA